MFPSPEDQAGGPLRTILEYPLPNGKVMVTLQGQPPGWVEPTLKSLGHLLRLQPNWDSYGARSINADCVWAAWQLLMAVLREDSPAPFVVPTCRGGIQIEWHTQGVDLEVEVIAPGQFHLLFEEAGSGEMWEKEMTDDVGDLVACVAKLRRLKEPEESGRPGA